MYIHISLLPRLFSAPTGCNIAALTRTATWQTSAISYRSYSLLLTQEYRTFSKVTMSASHNLSSHFCWSLSYLKSSNTDKISKYTQFLFAGFYSQLIHRYQAVSHIPGLRVPLHPLGLPGALLRTTWWNPAGFDSLWVRRNSRKHLYFSFCAPLG